ncbi:MAG: hypothetical protein ACK41C_10285 [Phenylobacterium sp.]|uniref:hypothetical protein n=1 Tax=Phenylobacterium sp. TaxID=1871053 RepID=UPI00391973ED
MAKARGDNRTGDLFEGTYFPVRAPSDLPRALDMKRAIAVAMGEALRTCGKGAAVVAAEMSELLGDDEVTKAQLYAYTAESRTSHTISIVRWIAFVRATGCNWLWDFILKDEGLIVLEGEEAHLAEAALIEKQIEQLKRKARAHREAAPFQTQFRKPRGRS